MYWEWSLKFLYYFKVYNWNKDIYTAEWNKVMISKWVGNNLRKKNYEFSFYEMFLMRHRNYCTVGEA